jgi:hypothetical protein
VGPFARSANSGVAPANEPPAAGVRKAATLALFIALTLCIEARALADDDLPEGDETATATAARASPLPTATIDEAADVVHLNRPLFSEENAGAKPGWSFAFHGYARLPLRAHNLGAPRSPYLVDDSYANSGFSYLRIAETEYAEMFFGLEHDTTRFVIGLLATQFSDWSETTLQGQQGVSTAFVEHTFKRVLPELDVGVRAGMFWDRFGYTPQYDTYLLGRLHVAGGRLHLRLWDMVYVKAGLGAHLELLNNNQGFTPAGWISIGVQPVDFLDASFFYATSWTKDHRELTIIQDGSLRVIGGEARLAIPEVGPLWASVASYRARAAKFNAAALEVLHSQGGTYLTQNFLGPDSDSGTGEILALGWGLTWQPYRVASFALGSDSRYLRGLDINLFGMLAWVASNQASDNPLDNFDSRIWFKWGIEPFYRPWSEDWSWLFFSVRYDRVVLDTHHDSLAFRVVTPKIGVTPLRDWKLDIFLAYSRYDYGANVRLRPNQIPGDQAATQPDVSVWKLQAQVVW